MANPKKEVDMRKVEVKIWSYTEDPTYRNIEFKRLKDFRSQLDELVIELYGKDKEFEEHFVVVQDEDPFSFYERKILREEGIWMPQDEEDGLFW